MVAAPAYRARTIKRSRRTHARVSRLDAQIIAALDADNPQSVRHVFYLMTDPRLAEAVEKSDRGYRHVQDRCLKLRRSGAVPYGWISDTSRQAYFTPTYGGTADFLKRVSGLYRGQLWERPEVAFFCEVWCESRSLAGTLLPLCKEMAVPLYPAGGFSSASFIYDAAQGLNEKGATIVFYVGDYDPAGVLIDRSIEQGLREHLNPGVVLRFERVAITPEQIVAYDLPTKPRKTTDRRALHTERTVEAEAMPAGMMRQLLRDRIEALLPEGLLASVKLAEKSERDILRTFAGTIGGAA